MIQRTDIQGRPRHAFQPEKGVLMSVIRLPGVQTAIRNFHQLREEARAVGPLRVAIVCADDDVALEAASDALAFGIATPQLLGDAGKIQLRAQRLGLNDLLACAQIIDMPDAMDAARLACRMAAANESDLLMKGHLRTDELLRSLLDRDAGLRTGRLLSDVLLYEDVLSREARLVGITDGGLNVLPTLEQKRQIVLNAIDVLHCIGIAHPRIAIMSATEAITESMPSTVHAAALVEMADRGDFGDATVFGPLALDNALVLSAAQAKGITSAVAGRADCLVVPNVEAGNLLGKAVKYFGRSQCAHVVAGARVPVLIPSRVESSNDKVNAMALGVLFKTHAHRELNEVLL
ncbi:MAG TPA: bifunctional enoyl-CoA hydratase/phosphate acetyltransferase [Candidatus Saccharimonadales bacterium]|nr:bifunctional enoyl-CoA hydratase/phosphate acetyltransferase [Candidatus Saccharimonadales bacterium]